MSLSLLFLILAGVCFVIEAIGVNLANFHPKWWALGVAFYLFSQAV